MTITQVAIYKTEDGKTFDSESDALAYTSDLLNRNVVDKFIDKHFPHKETNRRRSPHTASARRAILLWLVEHPLGE